MFVDYDNEKIMRLVDDFYIATGVNLSIWSTDDDLIRLYLQDRGENRYCNMIKSSRGAAGCIASDNMLLEKCRESGCAECHICHAGLVDMIIPIEHDGEVLGYIIMGQIRKEKDFSKIKPLFASYDIDIEKLENDYNKMPIFDDERIESVLRLAQVIAKHIVYDNVLRPGYNKNTERAIKFINENLNKPLDVEYVSKGANVSKSVIYKNFRECFDCTLSEYINRKRVYRASGLLLKTGMPLEEIGKTVGFSSFSGFCKIFKKITGQTPLKYRRAGVESIPRK